MDKSKPCKCLIQSVRVWADSSRTSSTTSDLRDPTQWRADVLAKCCFPSCAQCYIECSWWSSAERTADEV